MLLLYVTLPCTQYIIVGVRDGQQWVSRDKRSCQFYDETSFDKFPGGSDS